MPPDTPLARPTLELQKVSKFFGDVVALRDVALKIESGDSVLLYGPNGAGKTTLLRILATLARPTEGAVLFRGRSILADPLPARAGIGFVSHATFLYGELTGRENLRLAGTLFGLAGLEKRIDASLDLFGVRDRGNVPVRELSRGLQQRVTLARAFLHEPKFLLLDEPFTGLDAATGAGLQAILAQLPEQGKALVFSNHSFAQGAALARRLVALDAGRIRYDGPLAHAPLDALHIGTEGSRQ